jgi:hypothetical protein
MQIAAFFIEEISCGGEGGFEPPGRSFGPYNGLANSRFHTLLFGIKRLRSDELAHCRAKSRCSGAIVQLLYKQKYDVFQAVCGAAIKATKHRSSMKQ